MIIYIQFQHYVFVLQTINKIRCTIIKGFCPSKLTLFAELILSKIYKASLYLQEALVYKLK